MGKTVQTISASLEDYMEAIYFLNEKNNKVRVADLAELMDVKKPSAVKSLIKLKAKGLVIQEPYGSIELTVSGKRLAEGIAKRHSVIKNFLANVLFVNEKTAEEDACRIEHVLNSQTFDNLAKFIEFMGLDGSKKSPEFLKKFQQYLKTGKKECDKSK